jgi:HEPN domain-containing protein
MIAWQHLKEIAEKKLECSKVLFESEKYDNSLYLVGYSIEIALKFKICKILKLHNGFPETNMEFDDYIAESDNDLGNEIKYLKEIRNHNLPKLLYYSGQEYSVKLKLLDEWELFSYWNPELRYKLNFGNKRFTEKTLSSAEKLLTLILT